MSEERTARIGKSGAAIFLTSEELQALDIEPGESQLTYQIEKGELQLSGGEEDA
jgi:phosphatidate phosphatase PAH1